jgi:CheY-like chemotaxis protein
VGRKILIIDDEDDIREVASLSLETVAGWEVVKASSGAQGIARAGNGWSRDVSRVAQESGYSRYTGTAAHRQGPGHGPAALR